MLVYQERKINKIIRQKIFMTKSKFVQNHKIRRIGSKVETALQLLSNILAHGMAADLGFPAMDKRGPLTYPQPECLSKIGVRFLLWLAAQGFWS